MPKVATKKAKEDAKEPKKVAAKAEAKTTFSPAKLGKKPVAPKKATAKKEAGDTKAEDTSKVLKADELFG